MSLLPMGLPVGNRLQLQQHSTEQHNTAITHCAQSPPNPAKAMQGVCTHSPAPLLLAHNRPPTHHPLRCLQFNAHRTSKVFQWDPCPPPPHIHPPPLSVLLVHPMSVPFPHAPTALSPPPHPPPPNIPTHHSLHRLQLKAPQDKDNRYRDLRPVPSHPPSC